MARIRTLKPEFWSDEKLGPLPPKDRLVFLGLISLADDAGRLVDSVRQLNGLIFPYTADSCEDSLNTLAGLRRILRYTSHSGQGLIQIINWSTHQKIHNPSLYVLPSPCPEDYTAQRDTESSVNPPETLPKSSRSDLGPRTMDHGPSLTDPWPVKPRKQEGRYVFPDEFEAAWVAYPKRGGDNPKVGAYSAFRARVKGGDIPADLVASALHYREFCATTEKEGTPYVLQGATFWGPKEAWREYVDGCPNGNGKQPKIVKMPGGGEMVL
jgi:hypothetical protein